jgi:hypothetical protein
MSPTDLEPRPRKKPYVSPLRQCPDANLLAAWLESKVNTGELDWLGAHVDRCAACRRVVAHGVRGHVAKSDAEAAWLLEPGEAPRVSAQVGRYLLLHKLGEARGGEIYAAYDPKLEREVSLRLIHRDDTGESEALTREVLERALAVARVEHPHVAGAYDAGLSEAWVYLASELVSGMNLRQWRQSAPVTTREILMVMRQVAQGLLAAHRAGLAHRHFTPESVRVGDARAVVTDLAIPPMDSEALDVAKYRAPEQWRGHDGDERSDQFRFAVCLYEALYGGLPFTGDDEDALRGAMLGATRELPPRKVGVSRGLRKALQRALAPDPADRHASMEVFVQLLDGVSPSSVRRMRRIAMGAVAAPALVALGVIGARGAALNARCDALADGLETTFAPKLKEQGHAAFLASRAPYAPSVWRFVSLELDEALQRLRIESEKACALSVLARPDLQARAASRLDCLQDRLELVSVLAKALPQASPRAVERAGDAATALLARTECGVPAAGKRVANDSARRALAEASVWTQLGEASYVDAALVKAKDLAPRAQLALYRGQARALEGDATGAERELTQAFEWARLDGEPRIAVASAAHLAAVVNVDGSRRENALAWIDRARVEAQDATAPSDAATRAHLDGVRQRMEGNPEQALAALEQALILRERAFGPQHLALAPSLSALAQAEAEAHHPERAVDHLERALELRELSLSEEHPATLRTSVDLGNLLIASGRFGEARARFARMLAMLEDSGGRDHPQLITPLHGLARALTIAGAPREAVPYAERALELARAGRGAHHPEVAVSLQVLATAHARMGALPTARRELEEAVALFQGAYGPKSPASVHALTELAGTHRRLGDHAGALTLDSDALAIAEAAFGLTHPEVNTPLLGLGEDHLGLGRPHDALKFLERALAAQEAKADPMEARAEVRFALARALVAAGRDRPRAIALAKEAQGLFAESLRPLDPRVVAIDAWLARQPLAASNLASARGIRPLGAFAPPSLKPKEQAPPSSVMPQGETAVPQRTPPRTKTVQVDPDGPPADEQRAPSDSAEAEPSSASTPPPTETPASTPAAEAAPASTTAAEAAPANTAAPEAAPAETPEAP